MAYGVKAFIGIGKETAWGTAVAATDYVQALNESVALAIDRYDTANMIGVLAEPDDFDGVRRVAGDIEFPGHPQALGYFLKSLFVQSSVTEVASGTLYRTQFLTPTADFDSGVCAGQPYTLEVFRDVGSSHQYAGVVVGALRLGLAPNQDLRCRATILGKSTSTVSKTTPTYPTSPAAPFAFDTASLSIGGSATARIEALSIAIDSQLEGIPVLNGSTAVGAALRRGPQTVALTGTLSFVDLAEYNDFVQQTERSFAVTLTRANSFALAIEVPRAVYTAFPTGVRGRERLTADFEAKARYHTGSGTAIRVQLTTTKSNY